ncbi:TPA: hypothetical protein ACGOWV_000262 [Streptococcus suis]
MIDTNKRFAGRSLEIIELPGHTPGSIGLIDDTTMSIFVGDAITRGGFLEFVFSCLFSCQP